MPLTPEQAWAVYQQSDQLYDRSAIESAFDTMAVAVTQSMEHDNPIVVCVLNGGVLPFSALMLRLNFPLEMDYVHATRYAGQLSGSDIQWVAEPRMNPTGRTVLLVDDILDEGNTLQTLVEYYQGAGAARVMSAVLVVKDRPRSIDLEPDFKGLSVPDRYVFGYGMDYKGYLRNLPGIYAENPS